MRELNNPCTYAVGRGWSDAHAEIQHSFVGPKPPHLARVSAGPIPRCSENVSEPIVIDLFCGLGGWSEGFLVEGYTCIGFDIERHDYGSGGYPGQLVLQDILTIHGSQFKDASVIVASPPCQEFSYMAMPWSRAKKIATEYRAGERDVKQLTALFDACFRIQREASEAAGRHIPLIVENVRGAQPWVGRSRWHYGSFHLWGDVPALMPSSSRAVKVAGLDWSKFGEPNYKAEAFNTTAQQRFREDAGRKTTCDNSERLFKNRRVQRINDPSSASFLRVPSADRGVKGSTDQLGGDRRTWFDGGLTKFGSRSDARKAASAQIAKIPFPLSRHIARCFKPQDLRVEVSE